METKKGFLCHMIAKITQFTVELVWIWLFSKLAFTKSHIALLEYYISLMCHVQCSFLYLFFTVLTAAMSQSHDMYKGCMKTFVTTKRRI